MPITDLITVERISRNAHAVSKQHALELLSRLLNHWQTQHAPA